jgi:hypothetical protein
MCPIEGWWNVWILGYRVSARATVCVKGVGDPSQALPLLESTEVETQQQWKHVAKYLLLILDMTLQSPAVNRVRTMYFTNSFLSLFFTIHTGSIHTCNCYIASRKIYHYGAQLQALILCLHVLHSFYIPNKLERYNLRSPAKSCMMFQWSWCVEENC